MEHKLIIILDPAHGEDVMGKASPDGLHREYVWSRHICKLLKQDLEEKGYQVEVTNDSLKEIGLSKRQRIANQINCPAGHKKFLVSLHNNAAGSDGQWKNARGFEIWTSPGKTSSDKFAGIMLENLAKDFPQFKNRGLKENTFTVLMGSSYSAVLIEWLFQDNKEDVEVLKNDTQNNLFINSLVKSTEEIDKTL